MTDTVYDKALRNTALVVALGAVMTVIDTTIVNVAIHVLGRDLHASLGTVQWVLTGYLLALSMTIPVTGWAVQRFGARTVWITSLALFIAGSVLCGLARSAGSLIVFRVVQGAGGGLLMPVGQTMLAREAGPERMARAMAVVSIPAMLAPALGPVLGGLLLDHVSWRWMFLINVPVCAAALALALALLPPEEADRSRPPLDALGLALVSPGLALLVYGLSRPTPAGVAAGGVLLAAFAVRALRRGDRALIDLRVFADRAFAMSVGVLFCYSVAMFGALILIPLHVQEVRGGDTLDAGLLVAPLGAGAIVTMTLAGRITDRFGTRAPALAGIAAVLAGLAGYAAVDASTGWWLPAAASFVMGLGHGMVTPVVMAGAYRTLPRTAIPGATAAATILIRVGSALGAAILAVVLQATARRTAPATAFAHSFWWTSAIAALALAPAAFLHRRNAERPADTYSTGL